MLKVERAHKHFEELKRLVAPYETPRQYEVAHSIEGKHKHHVYRISPGDDPDPRLAVVFGDLVFNLRSALDHLRVALVPRGRRWDGYFPIFEKDLWERDPITRKYVEGTSNDRAKWGSYIKGMDKGAVSIIDDLQPFRFPKTDIPHLALTTINRLCNADKHRELTLVTSHMRPSKVTVTDPADHNLVLTLNTEPLTPGGVAGRGTEIYRADREVNVEAYGPVAVAIAGGKQTAPAGYPVVERCESLLAYVVTSVIQPLEPFVKR